MRGKTGEGGELGRDAFARRRCVSRRSSQEALLTLSLPLLTRLDHMLVFSELNARQVIYIFSSI